MLTSNHLIRIEYSSGGVTAHKSLPAITTNFVMRQEPWKRLMNGLILDNDINSQKVVVVSGMGGCGKTQLCSKFIHLHSFK
jgi:ABC-type taurine transport system ATPase subunit